MDTTNARLTGVRKQLEESMIFEENARAANTREHAKDKELSMLQAKYDSLVASSQSSGL